MSTPDLPGSAPQPAEATQPTQPYGQQPPAPGFPPSAPAGDGAAPKKPWFKKKRIIIPVAVFALFVAIGAAGAAGGAGKDDAKPTPVAAEQSAEATEVTVPETVGLTAKEAQALLENAGLEVSFSAASGVVLDRDNWTVLSTTPAAGATAKEGNTVVVNVEKTAKPDAAPTAEEPAAPAAPAAPEAPSLEHANALGSAQKYLGVMAFSRQGLIDQLSSQYGEGYPVDIATWAVDNAGADWNAEAAQSAQQYLDTMSFSRQGLYDQLTSAYGGQFTPDEANAGLAAVGY